MAFSAQRPGFAPVGPSGGAVSVVEASTPPPPGPAPRITMPLCTAVDYQSAALPLRSLNVDIQASLRDPWSRGEGRPP